eukprot:CAMPEP_0183370538 /NCGR_PEP_ID=MMETSP0164_2-20130417/102718_1 /TAXON_ID=221442 /ORGANISM="Coccolithus pelagicus ssp braarudi, Strain PLY182g" /LENGTH=132 /DNA_ID=CAMNT_0025546961 /DNA_START=54 /DNA_END=449 /DNA_ORIENTATION=+
MSLARAAQSRRRRGQLSACSWAAEEIDAPSRESSSISLKLAKASSACGVTHGSLSSFSERKGNRRKPRTAASESCALPLISTSVKCGQRTLSDSMHVSSRPASTAVRWRNERQRPVDKAMAANGAHPETDSL